MKGYYRNLLRRQSLVQMINQLNTKQNEFDLRKIEFEKALQLRNFEIDNFWKRGWFFGALLIAIASGYFKLFSENRDYCLYVAFLGLLVSVSQSLMNRGSKYWQERWENKTKNRESALGIDVTKTRKYSYEKYYLDASTLAKNENILAMANRFSVSKLAILVWDIVAIFWLFIWINEWHIGVPDRFPNVNGWGIVFHFIVFVYIFCFAFSKRRIPKPPKSFTQLRKKTKRAWLIKLLRFNGGKIYEGFTKERRKGSRRNIDKEYNSDSELYVEDQL